MAKERLDVLLIRKGFCDTREKARKSIMAGLVYVDGLLEDKPGTKFSDDSIIEIKGEEHPYVSRGGLKLEKAIKEFHINLSGKKALDIGASTGGFTHCMLLKGASRVYAIDVGYGQLAWKLRNDQRVVNLERKNARYLKLEDIGTKVSFATIDVSFISAVKIIPVLLEILDEEGELVCLVKPQFEAGRENVGKHGVVKDAAIHIEVVKSVADFCSASGLKVRAVTYSPIKGPEGNIEYLLYASRKEGEQKYTHAAIDRAVEEAHSNLN